MDFYEENENELGFNVLGVNMNTSDIIQQSNANSTFILSNLSIFKNMKSISPELLSDFLHEINQRILWENVIEYETPLARRPFDINGDKDFLEEMPIGYEDTHREDSIIEAIIKYIPRYLQQKYVKFDFSTMNSIMERLQQFDLSTFLMKTFTMFETLLPLSLKNSIEEVLGMIGDTTLHEKIKRIKDKSYIGILWNMSESYLSKCDPDLHTIFVSQNWEFINDYITKLI